MRVQGDLEPALLFFFGRCEAALTAFLFLPQFLFVIDGTGVTGELFALCLVSGDRVALGQKFADKAGGGWVVIRLRCGVSQGGVEGCCWRAVAGGGQG